jgi:hypothetical protein
MGRIILALLAVLTLAVAIPRAAAQEAPPASNAYLVFDPTGPNDQPGVWRFDSGAAVFQPLSSVAAPTRSTEEPGWPQTAGTVQAVPVLDASGMLVGYWVWNPYQFVGGDDGPTLWSPRWVWVPASGTVALRSDVS